jgi:hypothetical protein
VILDSWSRGTIETMSESVRYDITATAIGEFVSFLFDHEVVTLSHRREDPRPWYLDAEVKFDPSQAVGLYTQLFTAPKRCLSPFSKAQLEQGFWAILGGNLECGVMPLIGEESLSFEIRERCVRSMFRLFERFFADESLESFPFMWWDQLTFDWDCGNRVRENGGEDLWMQNTMFETLSQTLTLPSKECQLAALHGLGHLHHPDTEALILRYVAHDEAMDPALRTYAQAASRFEVR